LCECFDDAECTIPNFANKRYELKKSYEKHKGSEPWAGIE